ncbi:MAG: hypothetical protein GY771_02740 [bacterium]|nr:hypothetical protein [bacterium]
MRYILYLSIIFLTSAAAISTAADNRIPLYYLIDNSSEQNEEYPVFDISPSLGTALVDNGDKLLWIEGVRISPDKKGAVITLLEGTAPEAEWAVMSGGLIPYRRDANFAWFARAAYEADLETFFPGSEIIGLIEKHKISKDGRISPESQSFVTVIDDDFIGEICRSFVYDTFESSRGYSKISLDIMEGPDETVLLVEDTSCQFRVASYDWRRAGIGDFFRYRDGELHRDGFTVSAVEVGIENIVGGMTSDFSIDDNGRLYQQRTAYVEMRDRNERYEAISESVRFKTERDEIIRRDRWYRDMAEGMAKRELKLYKLPDDEVPPLETLPSDTPLELLAYFPLHSDDNGNWYLVESKDIIDGRKHVGWARSSDIEIIKKGGK